MTGRGAAGPASRAFPWFVVIALLTVAPTLRTPILAVPPVLRDIEETFGVDATTVSLLTTLPVIMFAVLTPLAALVIRRAGAETALLLCILAIVTGTLLRTLPGFAWMLAGMIVIGAGITVGNVVVPVIIRREVPSRQVAAVTAAYAAILNVGALGVTLGTAPLAQWLGWPLAILSWIWITLLGLALWTVHLWRGRRAVVGEEGGGGRDRSGDDLDSVALTGPVPTVSAGGRSFLRSPVLWLLVVTFSCQSAGYYAIATWLPTLLADTTGASAAEAGAFASLFHGFGIAGALIVPVLAHRLPFAVPAAVVSACWLSVSLGLLFAPELFPLWTSMGGIAHGGGFVVVMTALVKFARSDAEAAIGSALVQGGGYLFGAFGGPLMGAVHDATQGWAAPLTTSLGLAVGFTGSLAGVLLLMRRRT